MKAVIVPNELKAEYPLAPRKLQLSSGHEMSFLDEYTGEDENPPVILMVHGNPTWSYYYRNLVKEFSKNYRCIVPDHIGCGFSDKPQTYNYDLRTHISNFEELLSTLNVESFSLIVHDWGGAIGMGLATNNPERVQKVVLLNTAAYTDTHIPTRINICKIPYIGEKIVRHLNGFAWPATFMAASKPLSKEIKKGYLYPYNNYQTRIATHRFVQDIPMDSEHPTYSTLLNIEQKLKTIKAPKLILWGGKDFCFNKHFFDRWKSIYPEAQSHYFEKANHYVVEDAKEEVLKFTKEFLG